MHAFLEDQWDDLPTPAPASDLPACPAAETQEHREPEQRSYEALQAARLLAELQFALWLEEYEAQ